MKRRTLTLLSLILIFATQWVQANDCAPGKKLTWVKATYAESGDRVIIQNRRVKLNGIYAPQIPRTYKFSTPGQPLAKASQAFLNTLLANHNMEVGIEYDTHIVDEFDRQLVHLYLRDGTNIQQQMLENGYALAFTHHNNRLHARCYFEAEQRARVNGYQLWDLAEKHPELHFPLVESDEMYREDEGFRIIRGKVAKVEKSASHYIINLDTTGIRIPEKYWKRFDFDALKALTGKVIEVRGQGFQFKGAMYVVINHPNAINLLNPLHQTP